MAGFSMNRVLGTLKKRQTFGGGGAEDAPADLSSEPPDVVAARCVKSFCQSVGASTGDDVVYLPSIVEAAVASPAAAEECARLIRKYMTTDYWSKPSCQYNAVMLIRILADNPGPGFTRFIDKKFVDTTKELLRTGRDASVRQILMETLDAFENTKPDDVGLAPLVLMWKKEKAKAFRAYGGVQQMPLPQGFNPYNMPPPPPGPPPAGFYPHYHHHSHHHRSHHHSRRLPDPVELANRLEEARTSAKLLEQLVACTLPAEILSNDLVREFSERCNAAARSIQGYMNATDPAPDTDTMESLIEVNEQLQRVLNQHQRAALHARKLLDQAGSQYPSPSQSRPQSQPQPPSKRSTASTDQSRPLPPVPARKPVSAGSGFGFGFGHGSTKNSASNGNGTNKPQPSRRDDNDDDDDNLDPFRDPPNLSDSAAPRLSFEPYHPGFTSASGTTGTGTGTGSALGQVTTATTTTTTTTTAAAAGTIGTTGTTAPRRQATPSESDSAGEDVYGATPRRDAAPRAAGGGRGVWGSDKARYGS